jgi:hypothetical protein
MTALVYAFAPSIVPPAVAGSMAPSTSPRWGLFSRLLNFFRSAPHRAPGPEQSRPAGSIVQHGPRDGGAPCREPRRIAPDARPLTLDDYRPKNRAKPPPPQVDLGAIEAELRVMLGDRPAPKPAPSYTQAAFDLDAMRRALRGVSRGRLKWIAAQIGSEPEALWLFARGAAA